MSQGLTGLGVLACFSPALGGFLAEHISAKAALLAMAVFGALSLALITIFFKESVQQKNLRALEPESMLRNWWNILKNPTFLTYSALSSASFAVLFVFLAMSSFVFIKIFGFSSARYGLIMFGMSANYIAGTFLCRWLLRRRGITQTVAIAGGISIFGGSLMGALWLVGVTSFWAILFPFYLIALGHGIHQPCGQTGAIAPFGKAAGTASAVNGFLMMVLAFTTGTWLSQHGDGSVKPMVIGVWFWTACIAAVAWLAVQKYGYQDAKQ
jgi:DHA1 family bicyclomycin/chloramphenicol resistance-like MFS transporter